jgi:protein tyrosine phosphatase (PTP) superfamily phosphohydrolase (DUF442 family)
MSLRLPGLSHLTKSLKSDLGKLEDKVEKAAQTVGAAASKAVSETKDTFVNAGGAAIGYAEMLGLRYPVKAYSSPLDGALTRGSRLDAAGIQDLQSKGFKGIVNLCAENNNDAGPAQSVGMHSLHLPIIDNTVPSEANVKSFLDFATNPANEPCYVHCEAGQGRTGVMSAAYRMAVQGWSPEAALAEAKQFGCAMPDQQQFILKLGADLAAGKLAGYPLK